MMKSITKNTTPFSREIVFIDPSVEDCSTLAAGVKPGAEVHILKATEDGVQQISQYLKQRPKAKAIHVVSHGSAGRLYLGNTQLNSERLDHYGPDLEKWSTEDLLLYGCNVAVGDSANFVRQLSRATGARVAASANPTGNVKLGGDWQLGVRAGEISTSVVFNAETQKTYQGVFSEPNDTLAEATATGLTSATPGVFTHSGEIGDNPNVAPGLDVDLFKFDLDLGEQVRFPDMTIDLLDETGMPMGGAMVKLLDSTGMEATGGTSFDPSTYERIYRSELGGTYYIGVSGVPAYDPNTEGSGDPMYGDQLGDYTLNIETIGRTMGADEPNDTLTEATVTGLTSATPGVFTYSGEIGDNTNILQELDVDLFKFDLGLGEQVRFPDMIDLLDETGMPMGGAMVKLLDSTGMEVTDWTSDPSTYERIYRSELGGTYYVGISGVGTYDPNTEGSGDPMSAMGTGSYNLNIETIGRTMGADEPNDTLTEATDTGLTSATPGAFTYSGEIGDNTNILQELDVDLFKFDLGLGEQVRFPDMVDLLDETGSLMGGGTVKLLDSTGMEVMDWTSDPSTYERLYRSELGGTYYVGVSGVGTYDPNTEGSGDTMSGGQVGDYNLNIETIGRTMGTDEPNDTLTEATDTGLTSATPGAFTYSGEIGDNTNILQELDVDLFKFDLGVEERVRFPEFIDLLDETGSLMGGGTVKLFDDTGMEVMDWISDPSTYERIYHSNVGGTYYIGVSAVSAYDPTMEGSGDPMSAMGTGNYNLNIETIGRTMGADEPNDTLTEAKDTGLNSTQPIFTYQGQIGDNTNILQALDVDLFKFDLSVGEIIRFPEMIGLLGEIGMPIGTGTVKLFDSAGIEVTDWTFDPDPFYERMYQSDVGGTYYIGVSGVSAYDPTVEGSGDPMSAVGTGSYNLYLETTGSSSNQAQPFDFNADGIPDILWRNNTDGNNQIWLMNADGSRNTIAYPGYRNTNWQAVEVADFSNDGVADILWRNTTNGNNEIWLMNNDGTRNTIAYPGARDANWQVVEVANFSNDGVADILWRNTSNGNNEIWLMNNDGTRNSIAYPGARDANWQAVEVTDFSSDGVADILWRNTTNGNNEIWLMNNDGTRNTIAYPGARDTNWEMAEVADFSNDGVTDIFWRNTTNGNNEIWLMNNDGSRNTIAYPGARDTSWEVADTADFNGDNVDDIIWRNTTDGNNQIWLINSDGSRNSIAYPGYRDTSWSVADVADFSNDGVSDILWRNGTNGSNEIWLMNSDGSRNTIAYPGTRDTAWEVISDDFNAI